MWADAAGEEVPGVAQLTTLSYVDGDGNVWKLDPWASSADRAFRSFESSISSQAVYTSDKCEDPWVFAPEPPRFVMQVDDAYYVVPDDAQTQTLSSVYVLTGSDCEPFDVGADAGLPLSKLRTATLPSFTWAPPLHPEWR